MLGCLTLSIELRMAILRSLLA
ncbi:hypothetical protein NITMOv2_2884 [Nitrospira moscoviensis]|uniref:Uncharacterized protein n=1 Tax=Nitrospira moscoviensis TaxID=42253 RepID=A0A0K2GEA0_NITMO|nr:hypothetical protein NITMOv2_2884 [Nitrospira moscoviensis]